MKTVFVTFPESNYNRDKVYHYLYDLPQPVAEGDYLIVDSPSCGYTVVQVRSIDEGVSLKASKYIVSKIDDEGHKLRLARAKSRAEIVKQLEKLDRQVTEEQKYERLAALNPAAADLFAKLKELS